MDLNKILAIIGTGALGFIAVFIARYQADQKKIVRMEESDADSKIANSVHSLSDSELDALLGNKPSAADKKP